MAVFSFSKNVFDLCIAEGCIKPDQYLIQLFGIWSQLHYCVRALRSLAAATIFIAEVIWRVDLTELSLTLLP